MQYKGYEIISKSQKLATGKWSTVVEIQECNSLGIKAKSFSSADEFQAKLQADAVSLEFGRKGIDGKIPALKFG